MIEFTYDITVTYSVEVEESEYSRLAKHLGITKKKLIKLADEGELTSEYGDEIDAWLRDLPMARKTVVEESFPDCAEMHYDG